MVDKLFNLHSHFSLFLHLSHTFGLRTYSCDLLGERAGARASRLGLFSAGYTDTSVITYPVPELRRSNQGGPNKQTSLTPLFIEVGALPKQLNLSPPDCSRENLRRAHITLVIRPLHPPEHHLHSLASHERMRRKGEGQERVPDKGSASLLCSGEKAKTITSTSRLYNLFRSH